MFLIPLLPYPSFRQSVACYSDPLLLATLAFMGEKCRTFRVRDVDLSWEQQDLLRFWKGHEQAFIRFGLMCVGEAKQRDIDCSRDLVSSLTRFKEGKHWQKPLWTGWGRFHSDHRASLLHLGEVERIYTRIQKHRDEIDDLPPASSPRDWLYMRGFIGLAQGNANYITNVARFLADEGVPPLADDECPNHYAQFNWSEEPDGEQGAWPPEGDTWFATRIRGRARRSGNQLGIL